MENKYKIGEVWEVDTDFYKGTYRVISVRSDDKHEYDSDAEYVVDYEPLSGNVNEPEPDDEDANLAFAQGSLFDFGSTLLKSVE